MFTKFPMSYNQTQADIIPESNQMGNPEVTVSTRTFEAIFSALTMSLPKQEGSFIVAPVGEGSIYHLVSVLMGKDTASIEIDAFNYVISAGRICLSGALNGVIKAILLKDGVELELLDYDAPIIVECGNREGVKLQEDEVSSFETNKMLKLADLVYDEVVPTNGTDILASVLSCFQSELPLVEFGAIGAEMSA